MEIAINRSKRTLKQVSMSQIFVVLLMIVLTFMVGYTVYMKLEYSRLEREITHQKKLLNDKKEELTQTEKDPGYTKLLAAKYLEQQTKTINRVQSLTYLTNLLVQLKKYNVMRKGVDLAHFQISQDKVSLQGRVGALKDLYSEGGILDQFTNYPFIKSFRVPYYKRITSSGFGEDNQQQIFSIASDRGDQEDSFEVTDGYEFLLDADIYNYDGIKPTY